MRIADLANSPTPPNPIKIAGTIVSTSPVTISDGGGAVEAQGIAGEIGEFVIIEGDWTGAPGARTLQASDTERAAPVSGVDMVYVPSGSFTMGQDSPPDKPSPRSPAHQVYLSSYWIGKYEVTRGQYRRFIQAGGYSNPAYWSTEGWAWRLENSERAAPAYWEAGQDWGAFMREPFTQTENHPVVGVTYYEAEAFCTWAGGRLPTEAEWERAGTWSDPDLRVFVDANDWYDSFCPGRQTCPVGSYQTKSAVGCFDTGGNVSEWCGDWFAFDYYSQTPSGGWANPTGPASGEARVYKGGSWDEPSWHYTGRLYAEPDDIWTYRWRTIGFRLAAPAARPSVATGDVPLVR